MSQVQSSVSYTPVAKGFHWLMALIWICAWAIGMTAAHIWNPGHQMTALHKTIASVVIFLTVLRLMWRFAHRPPALPGSMAPSMQAFAHLGHLALYAIALLALPLSGWMMSSLADKPVMLAGLIQLPPLAAPDKALAGIVHHAHVYMAWFCGLLVAGHVLAAFKHHLVDRDDILLRMAPARLAKD